MKQLASFIILFISISAFSQGPWTQEKGKLYTQFSFSTIPSYDELFGNPDYKTNGNITDNTFQFYGEYGYSDKTTLLLNLPFKIISFEQIVVCPLIPCENLQHSESSFGNIEIGLKHNFINKNWLVSGQTSLEANTGAFDQKSGIRTGYDAWTITPLLLTGRSFNKSYLQSFLGSNIRTNGYSSNFKFGGEYGYKVSKKIWLVGFLDIVKSFENGDIALEASNLATGLYVNDQEYGGFGLKSIYEINNKFGLNAGFGGAFFGDNVAKAPALTFGLYYKF